MKDGEGLERGEFGMLDVTVKLSVGVMGQNQ